MSAGDLPVGSLLEEIESMMMMEGVVRRGDTGSLEAMQRLSSEAQAVGVTAAGGDEERDEDLVMGARLPARPLLCVRTSAASTCGSRVLCSDGSYVTQVLTHSIWRGTPCGPRARR